MGNIGIALLFALGIGGWVYGKSQRQTGGLTEKSLIAAGVCGLVAFIIFLTIASTITSRLQ